MVRSQYSRIDILYLKSLGKFLCLFLHIAHVHTLYIFKGTSNYRQINLRLHKFLTKETALEKKWEDGGRGNIIGTRSNENV